jgi:hypothetical protein
VLSLKSDDHFLFCTESFLVSCSAICPSFLLITEPLKFYLGSCSLCLCVPVYSVLFLIVVSEIYISY